MIDQSHPHLSIRDQCKLLNLSRSVLYCHQREVTPEQQEIQDRLDEMYTEHPYYGTRRFSEALKREGYQVGRVFTCVRFIGELKKHRIKISMDGKGRVLNNTFIERFWRTLKYEEVYIKSYQNFQNLIEKIMKYWHITKDNVETCRDCEFRYICFDCREIAQRKNSGNLYAANPLCRYNPYNGKWDEYPIEAAAPVSVKP